MRWIKSVAAIGAVLVTASCISPSARPGPAATTITSTQTLTRSPSSSAPAVRPAPFQLAAVNVPARPSGQPLPRGEVDGSCPYIRAGLNIEAEPTGNNFADLEGNRVQRVTRLTTLKPVGCRFYFENDYHPIGDILPMTYPSADEAYNAMVTTAEAGTAVQGVPSFLPGVDGISFRTKLYAPDAGQDWAFAFAKGKVLVVIRTDQNSNLPANAEYIAKAIANKF
jgi:hypothetical protein